MLYFSQLVKIIGVFGGVGRGVLKENLAGQKFKLGRTEIEAWQDKNGKLCKR